MGLASASLAVEVTEGSVKRAEMCLSWVDWILVASTLPPDNQREIRDVNGRAACGPSFSGFPSLQ